MSDYVTIDENNIDDQHICCAISDKKHQQGVAEKKGWIRDRLSEGHVFRKLDERGKVFIEYAPIETAWVPIEGQDYLYIYCLWVAGSFKGKGYGKQLLEYAIDDARSQNKAGLCILSSKKKKPFSADKKFMAKYGFEVVDQAGEYELLALSFDESEKADKPRFSDGVKRGSIDDRNLTIYYSVQCPTIPNCIDQIRDYCDENGVEVNLIAVDSLKKAKELPCVFNNWATFYNGEFVSTHLLNANSLKKLLEK